MKWRFGLGIIGIVFLSAVGAHSQNHDVRLREIMAGANGDSRMQFIVIEQDGRGENLWGPQADEEHSRAELAFFDSAGRETGIFRFPFDPPTGGTLRTLVATNAFANLPGAPAPDIVIPPLLVPLAGRVCFRNNTLNAVAEPIDQCVAYGDPLLPVTDASSFRQEGERWEIAPDPSPTNIAGQTFSISVLGLVAQGEALFDNETFGGNGRTCATCHVDEYGFGLPPGNVQARFDTLAVGSWDPLFLAETASSGFDFNLNTLEIAAPVESPAPCTGELRGDIVDGNGVRAHVLARSGPTTYFVYGGVDPELSGVVRDGECSAVIDSIVRGDLDALEDPARMREPGRALILENIDGFENPPVFRRSPHLLNLAYTAPYGLSGDFADLGSFTRSAIRQHFPRSLDRGMTGDSPDFREPTTRELEAIEAFLLAQEYPPGDDPGKFDLSRFATTARQRQGREEFVGFGCEACHGGPVLAETTISVQSKDAGINAAFDTGIRDTTLPCEPATTAIGPCGSREFSTPQLFNLPGLGPFFHGGTVFTVKQAVDFYSSAQFGTSPPNIEFIATGVGVVATDAITAFLEGLVVRTYSLSEGPERTIVLTHNGSTPLTFSEPGCRLTGRDADVFRIVRCPLETPIEPGETRQIDIAVDSDIRGDETAILEVWPENDAPSGVELRVDADAN